MVVMMRSRIRDARERIITTDAVLSVKGSKASCRRNEIMASFLPHA